MRIVGILVVGVAALSGCAFGGSAGGSYGSAYGTPGACNGSFIGSWESNQGPMWIESSGGYSVRGTYPSYRGSFTGSVWDRGRRLEGRWEDSTGRGTLVLYIAQGGRSFQGSWTRTWGRGDPSGPWSGRCTFAQAGGGYATGPGYQGGPPPPGPGYQSISPPPPGPGPGFQEVPPPPPGPVSAPGRCGDGFAGTWRSTFGTMAVSVSGGALRGSYTSGNGTLAGTVSGSGASGEWWDSTGHGSFQFELSPDRRGFSGGWRRSDGRGAAGGEWSGRCE